MRILNTSLLVYLCNTFLQPILVKFKLLFRAVLICSCHILDCLWLQSPALFSVIYLLIVFQNFSIPHTARVVSLALPPFISHPVSCVKHNQEQLIPIGKSNFIQNVYLYSLIAFLQPHTMQLACWSPIIWVLPPHNVSVFYCKYCSRFHYYVRRGSLLRCFKWRGNQCAGLSSWWLLTAH